MSDAVIAALLLRIMESLSPTGCVHNFDCVVGQITATFDAIRVGPAAQLGLLVSPDPQLRTRRRSTENYGRNPAKT
jgi:hypothetical protein